MSRWNPTCPSVPRDRSIRIRIKRVSKLSSYELEPLRVRGTLVLPRPEITEKSNESAKIGHDPPPTRRVHDAACAKIKPFIAPQTPPPAEKDPVPSQGATLNQLTNCRAIPPHRQPCGSDPVGGPLGPLRPRHGSR